MAKLRTAIASGNEEEVRKYLREFQPMLLDEKNAKFDAYQQRLSAGQVKRYGGAFGRQACLKSIMDTCGYSGYVTDALNFATLGNIGGICQELDGTLSNLGDLGHLSFSFHENAFGALRRFLLHGHRYAMALYSCPQSSPASPPRRLRSCCQSSQLLPFLSPLSFPI